MTTAYLTRARALLERSRYDLAEPELRRHLADEPGDAAGHALLAVCLAQTDRTREAIDEARLSIGHAPDQGLGHFALAMALLHDGRPAEAEAAALEAVRIDPEASSHHAVLAHARANRRDWAGALDAAEQGLRLDPDDTTCTNLRAQAMVHLGRREEAGQTIDAALRRDPDNAFTHANQGWTLLHRGDPRQAAVHFREALRLDPTSEWARAGIVESLKARHLIYRGMLAYFLWMSRLSEKAQWGFILGGWLGSRLLGGLGNAYPSLQPFVLPILVAYLAFVVLTWVSIPLFNLLLRASRFGRLVLSREQRVASNWVGLLLLAAAASGIALAATGEARWLIAAVAAVALVLPVHMTYSHARTSGRLKLGLYTLALVAVAAWGVAAESSDALTALLIGCYVSTLVARAVR